MAEDQVFQTPVTQKTKKMRLDKRGSTPILIPPSPCMKKLGYGTGVNIYLIERFSPMRGCYRSPWAVKKMNSRLKSDASEIEKRLEEETNILKSLNHPNIIGFRSHGKSVDGKPCLLMESGEKSLGDLIEDRLDENAGPFPAVSILKVAKSVASALDYLHRKCQLLHGDLKSLNVLVKGNFDAIKLCDFGVTIKLNEKLVVEDPTQCYIGTECWAAPEVVMGEELSNKTDMFSYGLILWEMIGLSAPHLDLMDFDSELDESNSALSADELEERHQQDYENAIGTRPPLPNVKLDETYNQVLEIFHICTEKNPKTRLSALDILSHFFPEDAPEHD